MKLVTKAWYRVLFRRIWKISYYLFCPNSMEKWALELGYFSISFEKITFYTEILPWKVELWIFSLVPLPLMKKTHKTIFLVKISVYKITITLTGDFGKLRETDGLLLLIGVLLGVGFWLSTGLGITNLGLGVFGANISKEFNLSDLKLLIDFSLILASISSTFDDCRSYFDFESFLSLELLEELLPFPCLSLYLSPWLILWWWWWWWWSEKCKQNFLTKL